MRTFVEQPDQRVRLTRVQLPVISEAIDNKKANTTMRLPHAQGFDRLLPDFQPRRLSLVDKSGHFSWLL
jgi:hypothetical protein